MKKFVSILLVFVLASALSGMAFADTPDGLTAEMYQHCVDDTPDGCYLAGVDWQQDGNVTNIEALYLPTGTIRAAINPSKIVSIWYNSVLILQYKLSGNVSYNGTTATVTACSCSLEYENVSGRYTVDARPPVKQSSNGNPAVISGHFYYDVYDNGVYEGYYTATRSLYCDANGNYW